MFSRIYFGCFSWFVVSFGVLVFGEEVGISGFLFRGMSWKGGEIFKECCSFDC